MDSLCQVGSIPCLSFCCERVNRAVKAELQQGFKDRVRSLPPGVLDLTFVLIDSLYLLIVIAVFVISRSVIDVYFFKVYIGGDPGAALS